MTAEILTGQIEALALFAGVSIVALAFVAGALWGITWERRRRCGAPCRVERLGLGDTTERL